MSLNVAFSSFSLQFPSRLRPVCNLVAVLFLMSNFAFTKLIEGADFTFGDSLFQPCTILLE